MTTARKVWTGEELEGMARDGRRYELLDGELVELAPNNGDHDEVCGFVTLVFGRHIIANKLGRSFSGETGYYLRRNPDRLRAPDFSFIAAERAPARGRRGFLDVIPDLVVEVVSPGDTATEVEEKAMDWLRSGVRLVLVVYPSTRSVVAYRGPSSMQRYDYGDMLNAEPALPGFTCPVVRLFPDDER